MFNPFIFVSTKFVPWSKAVFPNDGRLMLNLLLAILVEFWLCLLGLHFFLILIECVFSHGYSCCGTRSLRRMAGKGLPDRAEIIIIIWPNEWWTSAICRRMGACLSCCLGAKSESGKSYSLTETSEADSKAAKAPKKMGNLLSVDQQRLETASKTGVFALQVIYLNTHFFLNRTYKILYLRKI